MNSVTPGPKTIRHFRKEFYTYSCYSFDFHLFSPCVEGLVKVLTSLFLFPNYYFPRAEGWIIGLVTPTFIGQCLFSGLGQCSLVCLSSPLPSDNREKTSVKMKVITLRIAGCINRKHLYCASELTNPGTALPLDFLLHGIINSLYCSIHFWFCILLLVVKKKSLIAEARRVRLYKKTI